MRKAAIAAALGAVLAVGSMGGATAAPRATASIGFFSASGSQAGWAMDGGNQVVELEVAEGGYAGIVLNHVAGELPATSPWFEYSADPGVAIWGSPRIVVRLSNGGQIHVHPTADILANTGGNCPNAWGLTWAAAVACNPGATVTSAFVVADMPGTVLIDNLQWDGKTFGSAADNRR